MGLSHRCRSLIVSPEPTHTRPPAARRGWMNFEPYSTDPRRPRRGRGRHDPTAPGAAVDVAPIAMAGVDHGRTAAGAMTGCGSSHRGSRSRWCRVVARSHAHASTRSPSATATGDPATISPTSHLIDRRQGWWYSRSPRVGPHRRGASGMVPVSAALIVHRRRLMATARSASAPTGATPPAGRCAVRACSRPLRPWPSGLSTAPVELRSRNHRPHPTPVGESRGWSVCRPDR
ncbi:hypothetical protein BH24ACT5_BH24ACT5_01500 [soil metagenome]